ncbi:uncharacterized protein LOC143179551 [Calliopsis andreniformis]|uniref:uncharacterized protein LOC143179551 n=1 Tax=Calliopsis andreniformis TaxID=337506 RepID=UPI003FCDAC27
MTHLTICLVFYITILSKPSTPLRNISAYSALKWTIEATRPTPLTNHQGQTLKLMLTFINESPEFRPLTLSIVLPEFQSGLVDFLLRYITENSIETYISSKDLSLKDIWKDRILTWTFVIDDVHTLNIFIYWQQKLWKTCNQYLIVFTKKGVTVPWRNIFQQLWTKYRVYRVVVLSVQDNFRCLIRYMPFDGSQNDFGSVHKLCVDLFENFQNLNNYPVNINVFESLFMNVSYDSQKTLKLAKVDANVVYALEKAMKAKFHIKAMRKPDFRRYDPFDLSLRDIESGNAEMVVTGFFVKTYDKHHEFQFTCAVYEDRLCFLSPDSGLVPKAYMPFLPFEKNLWVLLIVYNILITSLWCFLKYSSQLLRYQPKKLSRDSESKSQGNMQKYSLLNQLEISHQVCRRNTSLSSTMLTRKPGPPEIPQYLQRLFYFLEVFCYPFETGDSPSEKALLIGTLFFGLIVNGLYQSCLVSSLSKPFHYPQLHTVEDVLDSGKQLITKYANLKSVFLDESPLDRKLSQKIQLINSSKRTKDMVAFEDKIAISRYFSMVLGATSYYDKEGNSLLWVVDECPMMYRVSYVLQSQSPYRERVNFILLRLREAGLFTFWFQNMTYTLKIVDMRRKLKAEKRTIKLTLDHYSLTFLLLFGGLFGSTLVFFGELYVMRKARSKSSAGQRRRSTFPGRGFESTQPALGIQLDTELFRYFVLFRLASLWSPSFPEFVKAAAVYRVHRCRSFILLSRGRVSLLFIAGRHTISFIINISAFYRWEEQFPGQVAVSANQEKLLSGWDSIMESLIDNLIVQRFFKRCVSGLSHNFHIFVKVRNLFNDRGHRAFMSLKILMLQLNTIKLYLSVVRKCSSITLSLAAVRNSRIADR